MSRWAAALAAAVGAACGLLAAPGLTWLDGGELTAAAAELGVAHPPGFPVFTLLHDAVMLLVPLGDMAFRGNLASGLWAAVAAVAVAGAARAAGARPWAAAAGALLFAASPGLLLHGTTVEVYTGAAAFTALGVWGAITLARTADPRVALALGLGVGLAAGHHAELRLFVLLLLPAFVAWARRDRRVAIWATVAAVVGATVIVYLPLRALADPWRNWGDPSTIGALWDHLTGARIRAAFAAQFGAWDPAAVRTFAGQVFGGAPLLAVLGFAGFLRAGAVSGAWLVPAVWLVDAVYATMLNPMGLEDGQNGLPGATMLAVGAALAIDRLLARVERPAAGPAVALALVALAAVWVAPRAELYTADRGLARTLERIADDLPPEALVLVASDNLAAGFAARQVVEGTRPDLAVIVRQHVGYGSSVEPVQHRLPHATDGWGPGARLVDLTRLADGWPVAWEWANGLDSAARPPDVGPRWPLMVRPPQTTRPVAGLPDLDDDDLGPQGKRALANWLSDRGRFELSVGRVDGAGAAFARALELEPWRGTRWNNVGTALAAAGRHREALQATQKAVELDPDNLVARTNLARYAQAIGDLSLARAELDVVIAAAPTADALALRGVVRGNGGDLPGAAADFRAALALDPNQPEARAGMQRLEQLRRR